MDYSEGLIWAVGILVVCVVAIAVVIPATLGVITGANPPTAVSAELWTGTAATAHNMAKYPILSVTTFKKAALVTSYNDTSLTGANGGRNVMIDPYAAHDGVAWNNINITLTIAGVNSTTNTTWVGGTCSPGGYNTTPSSSPYTLSSAASSCLTPGANVLFTFANRTTDGEDANNVTNVSITYWRYVPNTAYTVDLVPGTITPTATGYYYTDYTYGSGNMTTPTTILMLVPLLLALAVLLIVIKPLG
jgi:hypothetical protein